MQVGIEAMNVFAGSACVDLHALARWRGLDEDRFVRLLMRRKSVPMPFEDPVTFAVNAARPIIDRLSERDRNAIDLLIIATESGFDFGKAMSSYVQHHLQLSRHCRTFEVKHACYGGTAAFQMACSYILSQVSPRAKALVIATDIGRPLPNSYAEPSQAAAAVALLVGAEPQIFAVETGASGLYAYEVMDTCRPEADVELGDPDLSLLSYLDCIEHSFRAYQARVPRSDFLADFDYLVMHTPFGGMVKGAHRHMLRRFAKLPPAQFDADFARRVEPSLTFCRDVGNIYSGTIFLALAGLVAGARPAQQARVGLFSYGSGCCSEFYSGFVGGASTAALAGMRIETQLAQRRELSLDEYEFALQATRKVGLGAKDMEVSPGIFAGLLGPRPDGQPRLALTRIANYHREYAWH